MIRIHILSFIFTLLLVQSVGLAGELKTNQTVGVELVVLGVAQDAGYPQINCYLPHCMRAWNEPSLRRLTSALGVIDHDHKKKYIFDATPDIKQQLFQLNALAPDGVYEMAGVFLTHAHMGHYTGLMHFGREAAGTKEVPVYAMPQMQKFITSNQPWKQLLALKNITLKAIENKKQRSLSHQLKVTPIQVPHRDELSETVGFLIKGAKKTALYIPDIDKWEKWGADIKSYIKAVDYAFLDGTFFENGELPNRDMSEIPHPFVEESLALFAELSMKDKQKVFFTHFNHSNPLLIEASEAQKLLKQMGYPQIFEGLRLVL